MGSGRDRDIKGWRYRGREGVTEKKIECERAKIVFSNKCQMMIITIYNLFSLM